MKHLDPQHLRDYVDERISDVDAWSVESHVMSCAGCREELAALSAAVPAVAAPLNHVAAALATLPMQARTTSKTARFAAALGLRHPDAPWLAGVALVLAAAALLDHLTSSRGWLSSWLHHSEATGALAWFAGGGTWLALLAPVVPIVGVGMAYHPGLDRAHELVTSTASSGIRLLAWRTVGVLLIALPLAVLAQAAGVRSPSSEGFERSSTAAGLVLWLLPALALTVTTLALGTVIDVERAALAVALIWVGGCLAPVLAGSAPVLLTAVSNGAWLTLAGLSLMLLTWRRHVAPMLGGTR